MEKFTNITIKKNIAQRFIKFSRRYYKTHTETLAGMLDFFYYNEISPKEKFGPTGRRIENTLKKRIDAVIAIMKDVEKNKANPTLAILESLMEAANPKNKNQLRDYEEDDTHPDFYK